MMAGLDGYFDARVANLPNYLLRVYFERVLFNAFKYG